MIQTIAFVNQVLDSLTSQVHRNCLRYLSEICSSQDLLPRSMEIPPCYDPTGDPFSRGGLADVWKGQWQGQIVAVWVYKMWSGGDTKKITRVSHLLCSCLAVSTTDLISEVPQGGCDLEGPQPSKRVAVFGRGNNREQTSNGIRVDAERQRQGVHQGGTYRGSVRTCTFFTQVSYLTYFDDHLMVVAKGGYQGVNLYAQPGDNPWRSQRSMFSNPVITILHAVHQIPR